MPTMKNGGGNMNVWDYSVSSGPETLAVIERPINLRLLREILQGNGISVCSKTQKEAGTLQNNDPRHKDGQQ